MAPTPPPPPERQPTTSLPVPPTAEATAASGSRCEGAALAASIVRTNNLFTIIACDAAGVRRPTGGDEFEVRIHAGGVKLRCGVTDNGDGSYTVSYNPELSGEYSIDVTLSGEHLPGSPYTCYAHTRTAHTQPAHTQTAHTQTAQTQTAQTQTAASWAACRRRRR